jgi:hypothetical protein
MRDKDFLQWLENRIVNVYGENKSVDFLHKLRAISGNLPADQETANTCSEFVPYSSWISVEDRLPEDDEKCFMVVMGSPLCGYYTEEYGFGDEFDGYEDGEVTHWMPIPEIN